MDSAVNKYFNYGSDIRNKSKVYLSTNLTIPPIHTVGIPLLVLIFACTRSDWLLHNIISLLSGKFCQDRTFFCNLPIIAFPWREQQSGIPGFRSVTECDTSSSLMCLLIPSTNYVSLRRLWLQISKYSLCTFVFGWIQSIFASVLRYIQLSLSHICVVFIYYKCSCFWLS